MARSPLDAALADLLDTIGARTVRVVDGRRGTVVGVAGNPDVGDDPAAVARLVREAVGLGGGTGFEDLVVSAGQAVHVLRPADVPGVFVHLCLQVGPRTGEQVDMARRALSAAPLRSAVHQALAPLPELPLELPRPRLAPGRRPQVPALAALAAGTAPAGHGARAAAAIAELVRSGPAERVELPRRSPSVPPVGERDRAVAALPDRTWASDTATMRRLLAGLHRLA